MNPLEAEIEARSRAMTLDQPNAGGLGLVYFSNVDWNFTWQRPQQLASRLSRYGRVLYVNPLGNRSIAPRDLVRVLRRISFRLPIRQVKAPSEALAVQAPLLYLPFPNNPVAHRVNTGILRRSLQKWIRRQGIGAPIIWVGTPSLAVFEAVAAVRPRLLIYDCIDNVALFHRRPEVVAKAERELASAADVVVATADVLHERMKQLNPRTLLIPNGADFEHFSRARDPRIAPPPDVAGLEKPILGYVGGIAQWFDFELVHRLATSNPQWQIVIIGPVQRGLRSTWKIRRLPNVHYLGSRDYATLPAYLSQFDVCLIPFKVNAITAAVSPVKLYEYLATGKPVVSTPLTEVLRYRDVVEIAPPAQFQSAVEAALASSRDETRIEQRLQVARQNTWDARVAAILDLFREAGVVPASGTGPGA